MAESIELSNDALLASINTCINSGLSSGSGSSQLSRGSLLGVQDSMRHLSLGVNVEAYVIPWPQLKIKKQIGRGASGRVRQQLCGCGAMQLCTYDVVLHGQ